MQRMSNLLGRNNKACKQKTCRHGSTAADRARRICYRYVGLVLWVFLSMYVCSSLPEWLSLVTSEKNSGLQRNSAAGVSVVRSRDLASNSILEEARIGMFHRARRNVYSAEDGGNGSGSSGNVKIYVYDLPPEYNEDWLADSRCSRHLFAAEVAIHRALMSSSARAFDPSEADFFFVPVYVSCNFSTKNGFPALGHARSLLSSAVRHVSESMPHWNRSRGADHIFVATHDYGACFHAMEDVAVEDGIPSFLRGSVILQTFGVEGRHPCQDVEHIQIPPYVPPESIEAAWSVREKQRRDIWAFFRGKMEIHPKNISGRIYSKGVRTAIWQRFGHNRKFYIKRKRYEGYQAEILRSVFCLCPLGWAPWSPRIVESVALGCIPVIIADNIALPYSHVIDWPRISLRVPERDVAKLGKILERVSATNLTSIQRNLWNHSNRRALLFTQPLRRGDATWQILHLLGRRLHRSRRATSS